MEPLLNPNEDRLAIFPIKHPKLWEMYKLQRSAFWTPEEVDLSKDIIDWTNKLTDDEKYFIEHILAFFSQSDGLVNMNLGLRFTKEVQVVEAKFAYRFQQMMEDIHNEMYSLMIDNLIKDVDLKDKLFRAIETIPCIKAKGDWTTKWIHSDDTYGKRLIAFAIVEGIYFSGAFCSIYWLKQRNLMNGLCIANEFIARDEGMHCTFACMLYEMITNKVEQNIVHGMFKEAIDIEKEFITVSLPCKLIGMNADLMKQYIEYVGDRLLIQLGYEKIYKGQNPFPFMDAINLSNKTNFFEHRTTQYQKANLTTNNLELSDDF
jgi:ribonucleotide reductase beta subunit family protein with ferritin-like domain